jgi:diguanylate cyclase (GGDEF)-like protein
MRSANQSFRSLVVGTVLFSVFATAGLGVLIWQMRRDALLAGEQDTLRLATVLAEQTSRIVQSVDIVIRDVRALANPFSHPTAQSFSDHLPSLHAVLADKRRDLNQADVVGLVDAGGHVRTTSRDPGPVDIDISDREYFQKARDGADELIISDPAKNKRTGVRSIFLVRRITGPGDVFYGAVIVGLKLDFFRNIYDSIDSLHDLSFLMLRSDGAVLVRHPDAVNRAGARMPADSPWYEIAAKGSGSYHSPGYFDGKARIIAVKRLPDYPLVIDAAMDKSVALAVWRSRAAIIALSALSFMLGATGLLWAFKGKVRALMASEQAHAETARQLRRAQQQVEISLDRIPHAISAFDGESRLILCNDIFGEMFRLPDNLKAPGTPFIDILRWRKAQGYLQNEPDDVAQIYHKLIKSRMVHQTTITEPSGRIVAITSKVLPEGGWVTTHEDITERTRRHDEVAYRARHDELTTLVNRRGFNDTLNAAIARLKALATPFTLLIIDLDRFKQVNDTFGHAVGDMLLREVARRMRIATREGLDTLARLGGDEFAIIQRGGIHQRVSAVALASRLLRDLARAYDLDGRRVEVGASIGIACAPEDGDNAELLCERADAALYRAKHQGRGLYVFHEPADDGATETGAAEATLVPDGATAPAPLRAASS